MTKTTGLALPSKTLLSVAIVTALSTSIVTAETNIQNMKTVQVTEQVEVIDTTEKSDSYSVKRSEMSTKLPLTLKETPNSLSIITNQQMKDFKMTNVNDVLSSTSGVVVEKVETDRTYYTSRGFDITNFKVDGSTMPFLFGQNIYGDLDAVIYDRVEVVYGANALASDAGFPSATVNFVRKRPTHAPQAYVGMSAGSYSKRRLEADVAGALSSHVRGRAVLAKETSDTYLDRNHKDRGTIYGVIEADLGINTLLTIGHHQQQNDSSSPLWGAIPMHYDDGTSTNFDRSTSTAADWSYWNTGNKNTFVELTHDLSNDWQAKAVYSRQEIDSSAALFYIWGNPNAVTGLGMNPWPGKYKDKMTQNLLDVSLKGKYNLAGRTHDLSIGANWAESDQKAVGYGDTNTAVSGLTQAMVFNGSYPTPNFAPNGTGANIDTHTKTAFIATKMNLTDQVKVIAGAKHIDSQMEGESYGAAREAKASDTSPYIGVVYELTPVTSVFASYTKTFQPQYLAKQDGSIMSPVSGISKEIGVKNSLLNNRLNTSVSLFDTEQNNLAEVAGYDASFKAYHVGKDASSKGVQVDVMGSLTDNWQANMGYVQFDLKDKDGNDFRTFTPRKMFRVATTYKVPMVKGLKLGADVKWQDEVSAQATLGKVEQDSYALIGVMAGYDVTKNVNVSANVYNLTDEKYLSSLYWGSYGQGFYGAPRTVLMSVNWKY
jgi:outer membrane receptor for ferric coprogen and ferric-rhodotorulic acid